MMHHTTYAGFFAPHTTEHSPDSKVQKSVQVLNLLIIAAQLQRMEIKEINVVETSLIRSFIIKLVATIITTHCMSLFN